MDEKEIIMFHINNYKNSIEKKQIELNNIIKKIK